MSHRSSLESRFSIRPVGRLFARGLLVSIVLLFAAYLLLGWRIGSTVDAVGTAATRVHAGDRVEALIAYASYEAHGLEDRNRAVWALGQLGDRRALSYLESTAGGTCDHEHRLCHREIGKAIKLCRGATNVAAIVWR